MTANAEPNAALGTTSSAADRTAAERQARARERAATAGYKRIEFKVPDQIADEVRAMVRERIERFERQQG